MVTYILIGLSMGLAGGLLGIGGSVVMIPTMFFVFGENQHLY
ncbi:MAG: sulfite exporter TauE/SafE family protein, partial [Planctomycetes bacterium]|nr:sulfite exporter TauE/SafE family protein [Planctomycetota bacterium]